MFHVIFKITQIVFEIEILIDATQIKKNYSNSREPIMRLRNCTKIYKNIDLLLDEMDQQKKCGIILAYIPMKTLFLPIAFNVK